MDSLAVPEGSPRERKETWSADEVRFELPRASGSTGWLWVLPAIVGGAIGLPLVAVPVLMQSGALSLAMGVAVVTPLALLWLAMILGVAGAERWSQRSIQVVLGARGLEIDHVRWGLEQIRDIWLEDGRLLLQFQDGSRWTSAEVEPRDPRRLVALLRAALPSADEVHEHEAVEARLRRQLADLRQPETR